MIMETPEGIYRMILPALVIQKSAALGNLWKMCNLCGTVANFARVYYGGYHFR